MKGLQPRLLDGKGWLLVVVVIQIDQWEKFVVPFWAIWAHFILESALELCVLFCWLCPGMVCLCATTQCVSFRIMFGIDGYLLFINQSAIRPSPSVVLYGCTSIVYLRYLPKNPNLQKVLNATSVRHFEVRRNAKAGGGGNLIFTVQLFWTKGCSVFKAHYLNLYSFQRFSIVK